ncbi:MULTISPECIES: carboxylesterase family protein [Sphingomonas]|uniref:carboxylesterase/lipase family protein n=1 Tax=Sphingomonas TaxID=13687 RepID=UPI00092B2BC5|nr:MULTISPECIES: carboxylesterase family protein [Sphingomonas]MCW6530484.1 carboxylesterase family protein [Sphingomonas lycopersici]OJU17845.1 MAG: carboxylesterase [Sphingomonas sp. 66-10]
MRKLIALAGLAALAGAAPAAAQTVQTLSGPVKGTTSGDVTVFRGIPYAAPPVGANRWRAPQPVTAWKAVRDAGAFAPDCAQAPFPPDAAPIATQPSENCLYLNVWQPSGTKAGAKLPVMVWVHGGGFVNGGSSPAVYAGDAFARDGIVFVSLNYRLGRFGFFAHPALEKEGYGGNFGFLDQIAALKWVQANIAKFGGDPAQVTVVGESAGGMSMHMLLQSPLARGLFARAIVESGGGRDALPQPTLAEAAKAGEAFAPNLTADQLRALPAEKITGDLSMMTMRQPGYSGPMIDGRTITGSPVAAATAGRYAQVPVMIGANSADGFPFVTDKDKIFAAFGADADEARRLYDPEGKATGLALGTATSADAMMIEPARAVARTLAARQPVYLYRFAYAVPPVAAAMGGAPHASEIPYAFDTVAARRDPKMIPAEAPVAALTHRYWVNFVKTGRPDGAGGVPLWPKAVAGDDTVQIIDGAGARHGDDPYKARLDFTERRATARH